MKYLIYKEKPNDFRLRDGSILSALPCVEGFFIMKSQEADAKSVGWVSGVESDSITQTETTTDI